MPFLCVWVAVNSETILCVWDNHGSVCTGLLVEAHWLIHTCDIMHSYTIALLDNKFLDHPDAWSSGCVLCVDRHIHASTRVSRLCLNEVFDSRSEARVPNHDFLWTERTEERVQQRFEITCRHRKEAVTLHWAHGHFNNWTLLLKLDSWSQRHLKQIFDSLCLRRVMWCLSRSYWQTWQQTSTVTLTKRPNIALNKSLRKFIKLIANCFPNRNLFWFLSAIQSTQMRSKWVQLRTLPRWIPHPPGDHGMESLARIFDFTAPVDRLDRSTLKPFIPTSGWRKALSAKWAVKVFATSHVSMRKLHSAISTKILACLIWSHTILTKTQFILRPIPIFEWFGLMPRPEAFANSGYHLSIHLVGCSWIKVRNTGLHQQDTR